MIVNETTVQETKMTQTLTTIGHRKDPFYFGCGSKMAITLIYSL